MRKPAKNIVSAIAIVSTLGVVAAPSTYAGNNTDYAQIANIRASIDGPIDPSFSQQELTFNAPLTGSNSWHGFFSQGARDITIQLPMARSIQTISIEMYQRHDWGVYYPMHVDFSIKVKNQWFSLGSVQTQIPNWDKQTTTQTFSVSGLNLKSDTIRIHFPVGQWVFVRQIHVFGTNFGDVTAQPVPDLPKVPNAFNKAMTVDDPRSNGIHNMLLTYTGSHGSQGTWSTQDFLPMTGYVARNGQTKGRMFDTILFLPFGNLASTQVAWQSYIQDLFAPGQQLAALDAAVAETNANLQGSNKAASAFQEKVVIAIPHPDFGTGVWGSLNGSTLNFNASSDDPNALKSRETTMGWYIGSIFNAWRTANFRHLKLTGFYWIPEKVNYASPSETDLIQYVAKTVHANDQSLFWIPYYDAAGMSDWQTLGFDAGWLQPNYVELGNNANTARLTTSEQVARANGFGFEVELPWQALTSALYQSLYNQTLNKLEQDGFAGNVVHAFYAGSKVLVQSANSDTGLGRTVYDNTYQFITHK